MSEGSNPIASHHGGDGRTYMSNKIIKLQNPVHGYKVISNIFKNCYIFVNGYTDPPRNEVERLVTMHGGHFDSYQTSRTTHFVCDVFPNAKLKQLRKPKRTGIRYVTTQWVLKSIESRCRAPEAEFLPKGLAGQHGVGIASFVRSSHDSVPTSSDSESASIPRSLPPTLATESAQAAPTSLPPQHGTSNQPSRRVTSDDPDFIHNYFESSRLHFIGSWRARLPALLASVESESTLDEYEQMNDATYTSGNGDERVVLHVDMDCFFVSVLLRGR